MAIYDINGNEIPIGGGSSSSPIFVNVKDFGAVGDGSQDDAKAIQDALDSASESGGTIFFPAGSYTLTKAVLFYSNQSLIFEKGARLVQIANIDNLIRSYSESGWGGYNGVHDVLISGGTFDGGSATIHNTLLSFSHGKNITVENCVFKNAYSSWHDLEINSSYNVKIKNCDFEGSRKSGSTGELIQIDGAASSSGYPWDGVAYDGTVSKYIDIDGCIFHDNADSPGIGNHTSMGHDFICVHNCIFDGITSTRGAINFVSAQKNIDIYNNTFNGCTIGVGSSNASHCIHDNRFVGATTAISGDTSVVYDNMINGTFTP